MGKAGTTDVKIVIGPKQVFFTVQWDDDTVVYKKSIGIIG